MEFSAIAKLEKRKQADVLILPFWKGKNSVETAAAIGKLQAIIGHVIKAKDFLGKEGEVLFLYPDSQPEKRIALLGLGQQEKATTESLRRSYGSLGKACLKKHIQTMNLLVPHISGLSNDLVFRGVIEGLLLVNYEFNKLKHDSLKENPSSLLKHVECIHSQPQNLLDEAKKYLSIFKGVYLVRDLVNDNADDVTPQHLAQVAQKLAKSHSRLVKTQIFDKKRIEKEKMGLLLAVNRGSLRDPVFIVIQYRGNPKSKDHTVLIGKGITYDTGGLNLKATGQMETMRQDMAGAAVCLGTVEAAASLQLKVNFTVVIPSTENCIGARAYKPGDVYTSYSGKTVEIGNTDAEGRLILADALSYAVRNLKPTQMIDFATLTGAIGIALGTEATGLLSNDDALADSIIRAGSETFERVWRLPLYDEYLHALKSDIADIKNTGGRQGGAITAAKFLEEFVEKTPWAHCDIANTAFLTESKSYVPYLPKNATGVGVRLMVEFLSQ